MEFKQFHDAVVLEYNGCPWFKEGTPDYREKGELDELDGKVVQIDDYYKLSDYHAVTFLGFPKVYLTGGALKDLLNRYGDTEKENIRRINIKMLPKRTWKDADGKPKTFRPIEIM